MESKISLNHHATIAIVNHKPYGHALAYAYGTLREREQQDSRLLKEVGNLNLFAIARALHTLKQVETLFGSKGDRNIMPT